MRRALADALGAFPAVMLLAADAELVAGAPAVRRRFLDVMLALSSPPYLAALTRYRAALAQRNAALRDAALERRRARTRAPRRGSRRSPSRARCCSASGARGWRRTRRATRSCAPRSASAARRRCATRRALDAARAMMRTALRAALERSARST